MNIESLHIYNYGPFDNLNINFSFDKQNELAETHLITGENGTGKSSIIYALASFFSDELDLAYKRFHKDCDFSLASTVLSYPEVESPNYNEEVLMVTDAPEVTDLNKLSGYSFTSADRISRFRNYSIYSSSGQNNYYNKTRSFKPNNPSKTKFNSAVFGYSGSRSIQSVRVNTIKDVKINPFQRALNFKNTINSQQLLEWIALQYALADRAYRNKKEDKVNQYSKYILKLESIFTNLIGETIKFKRVDQSFDIEICYGEKQHEFDVLPDGAKSIISWLTDLIVRLYNVPWSNDYSIFDQKFILLLDEIDIHLHPKWQRKVLPTIQKLFKNAQIFASTHSPFVTNSLQNGKVISLTKIDGKIKHKINSAPNGQSIEAVLENIFNIDERFSEQVQNLYDKFRSLRNKILNKGSIDPDLKKDLQKILKEIKSIESDELNMYVNSELGQIQKLTEKELDFDID